MYYLYGSHPVKEFSLWKKIFDQHEARRKAAGMTVVKIFQEAEDSNMVHFLFEIQNPIAFKTLMESQEMKDMMHKAGVLKAPTLHMLRSSP